MKSLPRDESLTPAPEFRERAPRIMTVLTTGKLILEDREVLCRLRNLSATGMMVETSAPLEVDQQVRVGMRSGDEFAARVAWSRDGAAGLALLAPINVEAALAVQPPRSRISRHVAARAPRLALELPIEVDARGQPHSAVLLNISQSGARLRLPFRPLPDERLLLCIQGLPHKSGTVRWVRETEVGLGFFEALPFAMLADWGEAYASEKGR
jgi:hypothetical protein